MGTLCDNGSGLFPTGVDAKPPPKRLKTDRPLVSAQAGLASLAALLPITAMAQTIMEEIVVTAQKVEQSVDDVPVAVSAMSGEALRELGFQSSADIASQ